MPSVFILGPSRWLDADNVLSRLEGDPLETRRALVDLAGRFDAEAFVMEDQEPQQDETNSAMFRRLVRERDVQAFLVLLPLGARLHGVEKEFGALLEWLEQGWLTGDKVYVLAEKSLYEESEDGQWGALSEPGNRTRYHEDLPAHDVRLRLWDDIGSMTAHAISVFAEARSNPTAPWHEALQRAQ